MTDQQVLNYAEKGLKQGKSQQQLVTELAARGVTREQAERVKALYERNGFSPRGYESYVLENGHERADFFAQNGEKCRGGC